MNFSQLVNTIIQANTAEFPNRKFHLQKNLENDNEGGIYIANSQGWDDNSKEFMLKKQKEMKEDEKDFITKLIKYQREYENRKDQNQLPTNILKLYDYFQWQSNYYIVMENCEQSLLEYIEFNKEVSVKEKEGVMIQITLPILYLHKEKLIHRNIKSENFKKVENVFKLIDFSLVRDSNPFDIKTMQIGTLIFQAPEMIQNSNNYTDKIDIWSLACVFYEILSAQPLFDGIIFLMIGQTYQQITSQILNHGKCPNYINNKISQLNTSETIKQLLIKMLTYEQSKRPTIQDVYDELQQWLKNFEVSRHLNSQIIQENIISLPNQHFPNRKFQIINLLGKGTQGQVYLVKSTDWGKNDQKQFAVKQQPKLNDNELQIINTIINNQKSQFNLASQVIKIYEICQQNNQAYLIMETGEQDLCQYIEQQQQQLSLEQKIKIMQQLSQSIYFFHETLKLIHRDIKPENFIKVGDEFKLIDFGLAKTVQGLQMKQNVGTPYFQAPEIVKNSQDYTYAVDIWSLGCVFYELYKSQPLFQADTKQEIQNIVLNLNQQYLEDKLNQDQIPQSLKTLLISMIKQNPKDRLSIKEVVTKLYQIQNNNFLVQNNIQKFNQQFQQQNNFPQQNQSIQFNKQIQQCKQQQQQSKDQDQKQIEFNTLIQLEKSNFQEGFKNLQDQQDKYQQRITQQIELFQNQFDTTLNDLKKQFNDQNNQQLKVQHSNNENITKVIMQEYQLIIKKLELEKKQQDMQIKELNQSITEFKIKIQEQNIQINTHKDKEQMIQQLQKKIQDQRILIEQYKKNIKKYQEESIQLNQLQNTIQENEKRIQEYQDIIQDQKTQLQKLNETILDSKQIKELENKFEIQINKIINSLEKQKNQNYIQFQQPILMELKQIKQNIQNQQEYNQQKIDELKQTIQQDQENLNLKNKLIDAVKNEIPQFLEYVKKHPNQALTLNQSPIKQNINALTDSISKDINKIKSILDDARTQIRNLIQETKKNSVSLEKVFASELENFRIQSEIFNEFLKRFKK